MTDLHQLEKESLLTAMRTTKNKRLYERYQAVYLYLQNYSKTEIASMIGRSERTIYSYVNAYKAKGLSV
ncbi:terminase gpP N-terminus-related DNA-binding protein [Bacillus sp. GeD10]|uniref:terminase gpP N-terminus-related DNA-binding protein n=1 Tax=Bacillus sp. GeD10 TaxID=1301086 RepID=UPI0002D24924|nr:helix-turn-helix domain-containing protein [Bacillus sp. GeD10]CCW04015.1 transposase (21) [Bacillus sp. GeD10]